MAVVSVLVICTPIHMVLGIVAGRLRSPHAISSKALGCIGIVSSIACHYAIAIGDAVGYQAVSLISLVGACIGCWYRIKLC